MRKCDFALVTPNRSDKLLKLNTMLVAEKFLEDVTFWIGFLVFWGFIFWLGSFFYTVPKNQKKYKEQLKKEDEEIEKRSKMREKGIRPEDHEHHHHAHHHHKKFNLTGFMIWGGVIATVLFISVILFLNGCMNRNKKSGHREFVKIEKEAHKHVPLFYCRNFIIEYQEADQLQAYSG